MCLALSIPGDPIGFRDHVKRLETVVASASTLHTALSELASSAFSRSLHGLDIIDLGARLSRLIELARTVTGSEHINGRGRPRNQRVDDLIAYVWDLYPKGAAKKGAGSHFERTIHMLLGFLNFYRRDEEDPDDYNALHNRIINSLHRSHSR